MTATLVDPAGHPGALAPEPVGGDAPPRPRLTPGELVVLARGLARNAALWPELARPAERTWARMASSEDFDAWLVAWPTGGALEWHDHGEAAGALVVVQGELVETTLRSAADGTVELAVEAVGAGAASAFEAHRVHDVVNLGTEAALSVHVYAPPLTAMTFYEIDGGTLRAGRTVRYEPGEAAP